MPEGEPGEVRPESGLELELRGSKVARWGESWRTSKTITSDGLAGATANRGAATFSDEGRSGTGAGFRAITSGWILRLLSDRDRWDSRDREPASSDGVAKAGGSGNSGLSSWPVSTRVGSQGGDDSA